MWYRYAETRNFSEKSRREVLKYVPQLIGNIRSIIDFGCSTCVLLDLLPEGIEKYGVEVDEEARRVCISKGYKVFRSIDECPTVECITMVDVLELLPKIKSKLVRGGKLYIQTYNPHCVFAIMDFYNDFTHRFMWTIDSLKAVLKIHGFRVIKAGYIFPLCSSKRIVNLLMRLSTKFFDKKYLYMEEYVLAENVG